MFVVSSEMVDYIKYISRRVGGCLLLCAYNLFTFLLNRCWRGTLCAGIVGGIS